MAVWKAVAAAPALHDASRKDQPRFSPQRLRQGSSIIFLSFAHPPNLLLLTCQPANPINQHITGQLPTAHSQLPTLHPQFLPPDSQMPPPNWQLPTPNCLLPTCDWLPPNSLMGAMARYGSQALMVGTTIRLARVLWIVPLAFVVALWRKTAKASIGPGSSCFSAWRRWPGPISRCLPPLPLPELAGKVGFDGDDLLNWHGNFQVGFEAGWGAPAATGNSALGDHRRRFTCLDSARADRHLSV